MPVPGPNEPYDLNINPQAFTKLAQWLSDYPDICRIQPQSRKNPTFILNHPDYIKQVLIDRHKHYHKGLGFERVKLLLGNGIIVSDGEHWKRQRRMVQPAFHRDMLLELRATIYHITQDLLSDWQQLAAQRGNIAINQAMSEFGLEVILRSIFSDDLDWIIAEHGHNPFNIFTEQQDRDLELAMKFRALTRLMQAVIDKRRATNKPRVDMLAALLAARDLDGQAMTDRALLDEIMTLIVAGHETSAATLTWIWYLLSQHPAIESRLQTEVDQAAIDKPDFSASQLRYCEQIMFETLRLYPPVWLFSRKALAEDRIGDYKIPAGADVFISPYFLHRRAEYWPMPDQFDPERFADGWQQRQHRTAYIPFSAGPRKCIGDVLSILEIQTHIGIITQKLQLRSNQASTIELEPAINLRSKHDIIMFPQQRS